MDSRLFANLQNAIEIWRIDNAESSEWMNANAWWPDDLEELMARAAAAVFDANISGQHFAEEQND